MKNMSIRTKILSGVVLVNLIGMIVVGVYLHQSYSGGLDVAAQKSATVDVALWNEMQSLATDEYGPPTNIEAAKKYVEDMKAITGADYGVMLDKTALPKEEYAKQLEAAGLPDNYDERETYVLLASTDAAIAEEMQLQATPDSIPEIGKVVGVENGACSKTCHGAVSGSGDFWKVRWSKDSISRAHVVFPIVGANGQTLGVVYGIDNIAAAADAARKSLVQTLLVIVGGLVIATIVIALMLNALIFKRLDRMMSSMEEISLRIAGGDFDAHFQPDGSNDEIGKFEQFFARFLDLMSGTLKSLVGRG